MPEPTALPVTPTPSTSSVKTSVLVVDDESLVREMVTTILQRDGYEVSQARSAAEGLSLAASEDFDLAIVDYEMPQTDGLSLMSDLRELQPYCQMILFSGNLNLPVVMDAVNRGAVSRVLAKPVKPAQLLGMVAQVLESRDRMYRQPHDKEQGRANREQLDDCLSGDFINLALQPICTPDSRVAAFEGLLRSTHPELGNPMTVLGAAEELNQLGELAELIARRAVGRLQQLPGHWQLFINAHPKELTEPELLRKRLDILDPWRERLVVEITERTYLLELSQWRKSIRILSDAGYSLAVDDLGSGYNSLIVLAELQPQFMKVDMSMVRGVDTDPRKQRLIEMLVRFADSTDARVIAEGIETPGEAKALIDCGVHMLQGFYFGRPTTDLRIISSQLDAVLPVANAS